MPKNLSERSYQITQATAAAYRASRQARPAKILQVPTVDGGTRPTLVPFKPKPISWAQARKLGEAYGRVLDQLPKFPTDKQREALGLTKKASSARPKKVERVRPHPKGDWWMNKLADLIEKRRNA